MQLLRDLGFGKGSMEEKVIEEVGYLLEYIDKREGHPINVQSMLTPSISNNISQLVFGHRYEIDDPKRVLLDKMIDDSSVLFSNTGMVSTFPTWLTTLVLTIGSVGQMKTLKAFFNIFE